MIQTTARIRDSSLEENIGPGDFGLCRVEQKPSAAMLHATDPGSNMRDVLR